jgi:hypothetical protein
MFLSFLRIHCGPNDYFARMYYFAQFKCIFRIGISLSPFLRQLQYLAYTFSNQPKDFNFNLQSHL